MPTPQEMADAINADLETLRTTLAGVSASLLSIQSDVDELAAAVGEGGGGE